MYKVECPFRKRLVSRLGHVKNWVYVSLEIALLLLLLLLFVLAIVF
ncbi:MAG: hypothetical protein OHK0039_45620 [Bacteroidia bacterium]